MTRDDFLAAIIERPDYDPARLRYADWLDEQGECERSEFIRVQIELVQLEVADFGSECSWGGSCVCPSHERLRALRRRERELLAANFGAWTDGLPESLVTKQCPHCIDAVPDWETNAIECRQCDGIGLIGDQDNVEFGRGFVTAVACTAEDWLTHGDAISAPVPLPEVIVPSWQPVGDVMLTTWPTYETREPGYAGGEFRLGNEPWLYVFWSSMADTNAPGIEERLLHRRWPRVKKWCLPQV